MAGALLAQWMLPRKGSEVQIPLLSIQITYCLLHLKDEKEARKLPAIKGSGCNSGYGVVASHTKGPWFKSGYRQNFTKNTFYC